MRPSYVPSSPSRRQRAQGKPGARCTRGLACICAQKARTRAYRSSGEHPAFPAQWFTAYFVLSPVNGFIATVTAWISRSIRCATTQLDASTAASGPRLRRTRHAPSSCAHSASTASHRNVRDDRDPPLSRVRRAELCRLFARRLKRNIFARRGGQTFGDLPVVPIGRMRKLSFVIASEEKQSIAPLAEAAMDCLWAGIERSFGAQSSASLCTVTAIPGPSPSPTSSWRMCCALLTGSTGWRTIPPVATMSRAPRPARPLRRHTQISWRILPGRMQLDTDDPKRT